jgi:hypothetical protein
VKKHRYASPEAFKHALEARIRQAAAKTFMPSNRHRQLFVFDRFLARLFAEFKERIIVKGGVALELRLTRARTTRDVDVRLIGDAEGLLERLQQAGRFDLGDCLSFIVIPDAEAPTIEGDGMVYGGRRFRVEPRLAGRIYGASFGLDVGWGDPLTAAPEIIAGNRILDFIGLPPTQIRIYPREAHIAEKLHAYTLPRLVPNSRVKDLPDLALLAQTGAYEAVSIRTALYRTFDFHKTHPLPTQLPDPPAAWVPVYARVAVNDALPWPDLVSLNTAVKAFLDPVLCGEPANWDPGSWRWRST